MAGFCQVVGTNTPLPHPLPFPGVSPLHQPSGTLLGSRYVQGAATVLCQWARASSRCPECHGFSSSLGGGLCPSPGSGHSRGCLCRESVKEGGKLPQLLPAAGSLEKQAALASRERVVQLPLGRDVLPQNTAEHRVWEGSADQEGLQRCQRGCSSSRPQGTTVSAGSCLPDIWRNGVTPTMSTESLGSLKASPGKLPC